MIAVLTTHPIQYQVPVWKLLAKRARVPFKVYFLCDQGLRPRHDPDFGRPVAWDIDLTSGYDHEFLDAIVGKRQSSFWWLRLKADLARRLKATGAQVLWVQGWQIAAYWQAVWQARNTGLRTWLRGETNLRSSRGGWRRHLRELALKQFFSKIDEFLYIGSANRQFYVAHHIESARLHSAPYCVENARFASQAERGRTERAAIRVRWKIPPDAACVLFAGKLIPKKRPLELVLAAEALKSGSAHRSMHLLFAGTGELLPEVRHRCRVAYDFEGAAVDNLGGDDSRVTASFAGFLNQSEIADAYAAADCLALPSEATETWGLVVNEAMASGLPAVVSAGAGCSEDLVRPLRPDLCFPVGDIASFAQSLEACLDRPPSPDELRTWIDRYDVSHTVQAVERLYEATREQSRCAFQHDALASN